MAITSPPHPTLESATDDDPELNALAAGYRLIADCFVYPERIDRERVTALGREEVVPALRDHVDETAARSLSSFLKEYETVDPEEYVRTLELSPDCPLYLGHYEFDEPETCREIADADRNQYMVELNGIYEHYGFELEDELPDYLPAMIEFLWLTLPDRNDDLRVEFAEKTLSLLPGMHDQFEEVGTHYRKLIAALRRLIAFDVHGTPNPDSPRSPDLDREPGDGDSSGGDR